MSFTQAVHRSVWPRTGWRRAAVYFWKRILRVSGSPHTVAAGAAAGAFASFTPLIGFHFVLSFVVAFLVRGNMLAAALGTAVGNPLTFPLIWGLTYEVGRWILSGGEDAITSAGAELASRSDIGRGIWEVGFDRLWPVMKPMLVGGIPLGLISGAIVYAAVFFAARGVQRRRQARLDARAARAAQTASISELPQDAAPVDIGPANAGIDDADSAGAEEGAEVSRVVGGGMRP